MIFVEADTVTLLGVLFWDRKMVVRERWLAYLEGSQKV